MVNTVKRLASSALLLALAVLLSAPVAYAGSNNSKSEKEAQKQFKKYNKEQSKQAKKQAKTQKKQMEQWKKQHQSVTTVT